MNPRPGILFRKSIETEEEFSIAASIFDVYTSRSYIKNSHIIGRYSVLPYYKELETDLFFNGANLINSYYEHKWIADFQYYDLLKDYTFETWFDLRDIPDSGQFVVKGKTNSRKAKWNTQMFAKNRKEAILIALDLMEDPMLQEQGIIVRKYEPLELIETGLNDQPFVNEHRIFYLGNKRIASGYYWSQVQEELASKAILDQAGLDFADNIANMVSDYVNFFVLDIAKTVSGKWMLVEINDGQMSGLSTIDPTVFYTNLEKAAKEFEW